MARKSNKICIVCGTEFKGTYGKFTCGVACRTAMSRMISNGRKPEYWLIAKGKGQKVPSFIKPISKPKVEEKIIEVQKVQEIVIQEIPVYIPIKEFTLEEKIKHNQEIDRRIKEETDRRLTPGMHPRAFRLQQDDIIDELRKQKL